MYLSHKKEQFQIGYIKALSSYAGFDTGSWQVDNDSVDLTLKGTGYHDSEIMSPCIDVQLKATSAFDERDDGFTFRLKIKNYDDLRSIKVSQPRYLVVLHLPEDDSCWIDEKCEGIKLMNKCYWVSLKGLPDTKNTETVSIKIPKSQELTADVLRKMMLEASNMRSIA